MWYFSEIKISVINLYEINVRDSLYAYATSKNKNIK